MPCRYRVGLVFAIALALACNPGPGEGETDGDPTTSTGGTSNPGTSAPTTGEPAGEGPQLGDWEVIVEGLPFPLSGEGKIETVTVGRTEYNENFANRGVVEVLFDHPEETITIEIRKYDWNVADDEFTTFKHLSLWAFVNRGSPTKPSDQDPADDCSQGTWKDDCAVYAYYDGKSQPLRSGIDLRVHLPTGYRGRLFATTEDNDAEQDYPRRGDIVIDNYCGRGGEVALEAGRANIRMCPELGPAPACPPADIALCEQFPDGSGSEAWSAQCPCTDQLGQLLVRAAQPWAANLVLDVPAGVWASAAVANISAMKPHDCKPQIDNCSGDCTLNDDDEYALTADYNPPSPAAPAGGGYSFLVSSGGCTEIPFVEPDGDWSPGEAVMTELRGLVKLCTDCL